MRIALILLAFSALCVSWLLFCWWCFAGNWHVVQVRKNNEWHDWQYWRGALERRYAERALRELSACGVDSRILVKSARQLEMENDATVRSQRIKRLFPAICSGKRL